MNRNTIQILVLLCSLLIFTSLNTFTQNNRLDSLKNELNKHKNEDTTLVNLLSDISYEMPDNAVSYAQKGINIAEKIKYKKGISMCYNSLVNYYNSKSNYTQALEYCFKSLKIDEELQNKSVIASDFCNISLDYYYMSNYPKALEFGFKAMKIDGEIGNKRGLAFDYGNVGLIYGDIGDQEKVIEYYIKALRIYEELNDKQGQAIYLGNIGNYYLTHSNYSKALEYNQKSLKINEEIGNKMYIAVNMGNIAEIYSNLEDFTKALDYLYKALKLSEESGYRRGEMFNYGNIGDLYLSMYNKIQDSNLKIKKPINKQMISYLNRSIEYSSKAVEIGRKSESSQLAKWYFNLAQANKELKNWEKAFIYADSSNTLKDSIYNFENSRKIVTLEKNFEIAKKEKENEILKLEINHQTSVRNYLILLSFLVLLIAGGTVNRYYSKKKQNIKLEEKNLLLAKANNEIDHSYQEKMQLREEAHEKESQIIKLKNEMLQSELELKHKELTALAINLVDKNEYLMKLKDQAEEIGKAKPKEVGPLVRMITRSININARGEESWQVFETQFKAIHHGFMEYIAAKYPDLTVMEMKVCALLKINLSSKEIASMLNLGIRAIEDYRLNIRKKMNLEKSVNLGQYITQIIVS